jgi:hypothetical protein
MKPRRAVGTDVALWCVVKRRRREHHGASDGELGDVIGDGHPVVRRCEADPVKHAMGFCEKVLASVSGMVLGDRCHNRRRGVGENRLAEVLTAKQRQVVAILQARDPGDLLVLRDVACRPFAPLVGELGEAVLGLVRSGGDRRDSVQSHVLDGGRAPTMRCFELDPEPLGVLRDLFGASRELGHEGLRDAGDLIAGL